MATLAEKGVKPESKNASGADDRKDSQANSFASASDEELDAVLHETLKEKFGYDEFLPGQCDAMQHLLRGDSAAAVFPTGGGKSLCYQLPSLLLPGVTLVVSPLIALMKDQIDALTQRGIPAVRLDSTLSTEEYRNAIAQLRAGELRMLYVAPERFNNERFRELIQHTQVSLFAVDEAHCISEWGHAFRPDYLKLARFADAAGAERKLALTATATPKVLDDICTEFSIRPNCAVRTGFYRPNLTLSATPVSFGDRDEALISRLKDRPAGATIVYVTLQKTAMEVARKLNEVGIDAKPYHAGLKTELRGETQDWFLSQDDAVIVATIAFGMGVDKPNIRYVYHYNLPKSLENYSQEIGRAGRDGEESTCESLICADDLRVLENFVYGDTPGHSSVLGLIKDIFGRNESFAVSLYHLSGEHNIRPLVLRTLLTYLELEGFIQGGTPRYGEYRFKALASSKEILGHFEGERQAFVSGLLQRARQAKSWFHIDVDAAAAALGTDRSRAIRALDYMSDQGWLELQTSKVQHCYRRLKMPEKLQDLATELHDRCLRRQDQEIGRLQQQLEWFESDGCQTNALAAHFGETRSDACGHCNWCESKTPIDIQPPEYAIIDEDEWQKAITFRDQHESLSSPTEFARFLCGVRSPQLTREKLTKEPLFGAFANLPYEEIIARADK